MRHYVIDDLESKIPVQGVEMRIIHGERMTVAFFRMKAGAGVPEHAHPHEQIGTVLKGAIELTVDGEKKLVRAGEVYHVPSDLVHSGHCVEPSEILEVFSPVREDYK